MTAFMAREQEKSDTPNPYNQNKPWSDEGKTGQEFTSADDSMARVNRPKVAMMDPTGGKSATAQEPEEQQEVQQPEQQPEAKPYQNAGQDYHKRWKNLKKHHDKTVTELRQENQELKKAVANKNPTYTPPKSTEDLQAWASENPELYAVVESVAHLRSSEAQQALQEEVKQLRDKLLVENARSAYSELKRLVPDYEEVRTNPAFHDWAEQQPQELQDWVYKNHTNAELCARVINMWKLETQQQASRPAQPQPRQPGADQAVNPGRSREEPTQEDKVWYASEIDKMSLEDYEANKADIHKALREGRVLNG